MIILIIYLFFTGLCLSEFQVKFFKADSSYFYSYCNHGENISFVYGWALILQYLAGIIELELYFKQLSLLAVQRKTLILYLFIFKVQQVLQKEYLPSSTQHSIIIFQNYLKEYYPWILIMVLLTSICFLLFLS